MNIFKPILNKDYNSSFNNLKYHLKQIEKRQFQTTINKIFKEDERIMHNADVLIIGLGNLGGKILEQLCRESRVSKIIVSTTRKDYGKKKVNTEKAGANQLGYHPDVKIEKINLLDSVEKIGEKLRNINPKIIVNTASMITPWIKTSLPDETLEPLYQVSGLGPWIALQLRLVYRLMSAIKLSKIDSKVINASYADAVNPALKSINLSPLAGGGNLDNIATMARLIVAKDRKIKPRDIQIFLVQHYYNNRWLSCGFLEKRYCKKPAPFYLKILVESNDITDQYDSLKLLMKTGCGINRVDGPPGDSITASSFVKHILAILHDTNIFTHVPGPNGLIGGYPVHLGKNYAELALPNDISQEEAFKINLEGQRRGGIQNITKKGEIIFTDSVYETQKKIFNFDCKSFFVNDVNEVADEQMAKIKETIKRFK